MFLTSTATLYGWVIMKAGLIIKVSEWFDSISQNPLYILIIITLFLLLIGCFLDPVVSILILGRMFIPIIDKLGIDPIHFGLVMVISLMIGLMTPPYGGVLFVMVKLSGLEFREVVRSIFPFLIPPLVVLIMVIIFPCLVTTLPNLIMGVIK